MSLTPSLCSMLEQCLLKTLLLSEESSFASITCGGVSREGEGGSSSGMVYYKIIQA